MNQSIKLHNPQKPEAEFKGGAHSPASDQNQRTDSTKPGGQNILTWPWRWGKRRFSRAKLLIPRFPTRLLRHTSNFSLFLVRDFKARVGKFHGVLCPLCGDSSAYELGSKEKPQHAFPNSCNYFWTNLHPFLAVKLQCCPPRVLLLGRRLVTTTKGNFIFKVYK